MEFNNLLNNQVETPGNESNQETALFVLKFSRNNYMNHGNNIDSNG